MDTGITEIRKRVVARILAKQDVQFRWAFDEQVARERPELTYYWPKYRSTLWTLLCLADVGASVREPRIARSIDLVMAHFYDESHGILSLGEDHFPVPCLNGNKS